MIQYKRVDRLCCVVEELLELVLEWVREVWRMYGGENIAE